MLKPKSNIDKLHTYTPGKSKEEAAKEFGVESWLKLSSNENPFGCPVSAEDLTPFLHNAAQYPDQGTHPLNDPALQSRVSGGVGWWAAQVRAKKIQKTQRVRRARP